MLEVISSTRSKIENVWKLILKDNNQPLPLEVSYLRKGDGKDIVVVPSQTGCNLGCSFCHLTGIDGIVRNLPAEEIVKSVEAALAFQVAASPTLLVSFMGAGEPLMNVSNVVRAATMLRIRPEYQQVRFAVSTLIPGKARFEDFLRQVQEQKLPFKLHWSLHTPDEKKRKQLMPAASSIFEGTGCLRKWVEAGLPSEVHYTLISEVNDRPLDASQLSECLDLGSHIKLLRLAPRQNVPELQESKRAEGFASSLRERGFSVEIYSPPGRDINASCGQFVLDQYVR